MDEINISLPLKATHKEYRVRGQLELKNPLVEMFAAKRRHVHQLIPTTKEEPFNALQLTENVKS